MYLGTYAPRDRFVKGLMQMRSRSRRLAGWLGVLLTALVLAIAQAPATALAEGGVAKVGDAEYATFDEAFAAATDGQTVTLLADATTKGLDVKKDVTIDGAGHSLAFVEKGIALWGKSLTLKNVAATMTGIGSTPYTAEWSWMTICASKNASITLDNAKLSMDGAGTGNNTHAIYLTGNNKLNLQNGSVLTVKNYKQDALEWDGGDGGYNLNVTGGSKLVSDHNRSGLAGTFYATVDASTVDVINSTGNGSNGTYYTIKNGSDVKFANNGNWGISAWRIDMTGSSKLTATDNGYSGVWTRVLNVDASCSVDVKGNGTKGSATGSTGATNAGISFWGNGKIASKIERGANVVISNNAGSGIYTGQKVCNLTIGSATITNNGTGACNVNGTGADMGGGIYNVGTLTLDPSVVLYNNHAAVAGDDLYTSAGHTMTIGAVGTDWILDDCNHAIDSWYDDSASTRWCADAASKNHVAPVAPGEQKANEAAVAIKAAHGLTLDYAYVGEAPAEAQLPAPMTGLVNTVGVNAAVQQPVDGWTFDGWYVDEACTTKWVDETVLDASMTLYGKWTKDPEPAPAPEPQEPGTTTPEATKPVKKTSQKKVPATGDATSGAFALLAVAGIAAAAVAIKVRK